MGITVKTELLQTAAAKSAKGSGNQAVLALATAVMIKSIGTSLVLTTTDNSITLDVVVNGVAKQEEPFVACVNSGIFSKLIAKQTCENVVLSVTESSLHVSGDGEYDLPLLLDEEGEIAEIPHNKFTADKTETVSVQDLKNMYAYGKISVSKYFDTPMYTGYCVSGGKVFTFDGSKSCVVDTPSCKFNALLPGKLVELFDLFDDKTVTLSIGTEGQLLFTGSDMILYGFGMEGFNQFPAQQLMDLATSDKFTNYFAVNKVAFSSVADRLSLFVAEADQNEVQMRVMKDGVSFTNKETSAYEKLPFAKQETKVVETAVSVDLQDLKLFTGVCGEDYIKFSYTEGSPICMTANNVQYIIPLLEEIDEEFEEE